MERYFKFMGRKSQYCYDISPPNLTYRFNTIPIKVPANPFVTINKLIQKFIWKGRRPGIANKILKNNNVRRLTLPDFKIYYKATVINTV